MYNCLRCHVINKLHYLHEWLSIFEIRRRIVDEKKRAIWTRSQYYETEASIWFRRFKWAGGRVRQQFEDYSMTSRMRDEKSIEMLLVLSFKKKL